MNEFRLTVRQLAERLGGSFEGDGETVVTGIAPLASAGAGEATFVSDDRRAGELASTGASAAIVGAGTPPAAIPLIRVKDVDSAVIDVLEMVGESEDLPPAGIDPSATVHPSAAVAPDAAVGPRAIVGARARLASGAVLCANVTVGSDAVIGEGTILLEHTSVQPRCRIGRRCRIGPSAVIGSSGWGYHFESGRHRRVPHVGWVEIGDEVDIGACTCVDRGKFGPTRIGDGTKIDNLVQVAHNVQIGRGCLLAGQVGIAGSTVVKDFVVFGGHGGAVDNITVGKGVQAGACAVICRDAADGERLMGMPAIDARQFLRQHQMLTRLSDLRDRVRDLEKRLNALGPAEDH